MTTGRRVRGAGVPNAGLRSIPPPCGTRCGCTGYAPPTRAPRSTRTRYSTAAATSPRRRSCPRPSCCLSRARTCSGRHPPRKGTRRQPSEDPSPSFARRRRAMRSLARSKSDPTMPRPEGPEFTAACDIAALVLLRVVVARTSSQPQNVATWTSRNFGNFRGAYEYSVMSAETGEPITSACLYTQVVTTQFPNR